MLLDVSLFVYTGGRLVNESVNYRKKNWNTPWRQLEDLDFAEDIALLYIALLSHTCDQMQRKTTELENTAKSIGLRIHPGKSKVMKLKTNSTANITVENKILMK